jgi:biotin synthase-related radical SAM superfamily protein|tara:strand:- start:174 stop:362 length:189 start_codon:yes stop_codon:yes gene_type:complete
MVKRRRVPKDKKSKVPKKYLSGVKGRKRVQLANIIKRIGKMAKSGQRIPKSLIDRRLKLGKA